MMEATIADIHHAFAAGTFTCQRLIQYYLDRIEAYEEQGPRLNAITTVNPKALDSAVKLDEIWKRSGPVGPLHGIPVLLKDNIDTSDMPTTSGSPILRNWVPSRDASIVAALRSAGAVILGKASMGELAAGSYNCIDGQQINPYNFKRTTSGSSGGAGAAVAANFTVLAVGTDTYTSVRLPAAFNGIVGLRPTTGLISRAGIAPRKRNIDTPGPMGRTVADVALLLNILAGPDPADPLSLAAFANCPAAVKANGRYEDFTRYLRTGGLNNARIGVMEDFHGGDPEIDALSRTAIENLETLGARTVTVHLDTEFYDRYVLNAVETLMSVLMYGFREDWEAYLATLGPGVPKTVAEWLRIYETEGPGWALPPATGGPAAMEILRTSLDHSRDDPRYRHVVETVLPELTRRKLAIFDDHNVEVLVFPYQPAFAPPISNPVQVVEDPSFVAAPGRANPCTLGGYGSLGFPMIIVPIGFGTAGLPMGMAFMGRPYSEGRIIECAYDYEQATHMRRPPPLLPPL